MLDTNIFDLMLKNNIDLSILPKDVSFYITHIQHDEIRKCSNEKLRHKLLDFFLTLKKECVPIASMIAGVSRAGQCRVGSGELYKKLCNGNARNTHDALIAETCFFENLILITEDKKLRSSMRRFGGEALSYQNFLNSMMLNVSMKNLNCSTSDERQGL